MAKKKAFKDLTPQGQKKRLEKYAAEREARGTTDHFCRIVQPAKIETRENGDHRVIFRFAEYDKVAKENVFYNASAYVKKGKDQLLDYYKSLDKGDTVSVEIKVNKGWKNIYNMMSRDVPKKGKASDDAAPVSEQGELALDI